jgi:dephospho-CoA kinase
MTQPLQIIAFTGSAGTGKDTAADILVTHCGFTKLAFADAQIAAILASPLGIQKEAKVHGVSPALIARMRRRNPARTAGTVWAGLGSRAGA